MACAECARETLAAMAYALAGIPTAEEVEALDAEEVFARYLQANDPRERFVPGMRRRGKEPPSDAREIAKISPYPIRSVIGSVVEDDSTVHVVYQWQFKVNPTEAASPAIMTVRRTQEGWRIYAVSQDWMIFGHNFRLASIETDEEQDERRRELAAKVVAWPIDGVGEARAFVAGYSSGDERPEALVVEVPQPDRTIARVEIPFDAFRRLSEFLDGWPERPEQ